MKPECQDGSDPDPRNCKVGEPIRVDVRYSGSCPTTPYVQIYATSSKVIAGKLCTIGYKSSDSINGLQSDCTSSPCIFYWKVPSNLPPECVDSQPLGMVTYMAELFDNAPSSGSSVATYRIPYRCDVDKTNCFYIVS